MGKVVGCGLIAHVPTVMLPQDIRHELNNGRDFSVVEGFNRLRREVLSELDYDLVIVFDSHWFTTVEFIDHRPCAPHRQIHLGRAAARHVAGAL